VCNGRKVSLLHATAPCTKKLIFFFNIPAARKQRGAARLRRSPVSQSKKLSAGVHAGGVNKIQSLFRGHVPRKSTLRAELGPDSLLKKDASHLF
jgi:hypothetical protein